ncbi:MAG: hypothetical protein HDR23_10060 [Lachnospiraceae bacterium]|nr:hypothetical protein [Lachnospiraceae bacterium]
MNVNIKGEKHMAKIITGAELKNLILTGDILENADIKCAEGIKYDFRLGSKLLKSYFGDPIDIEKDLVTMEEKNRAVVEPGEVVFVLSKEKISLPKDIYIQLNPKRSLSQDGIELLGGLTVDPKYEGYLVFGLKNVAGKPYKLRVGTKIVGANFFRLSESESIDDDDIPSSIEDFPQRLQELIDKYEPVNPQSLAEELQNLQKAFEDSQNKLTTDVKYLKDQVENFVQDLTRESIKREQETKMLTGKLADVESKMDGLTKDSILLGERLANVGDTLKNIDERTKVLSDELIGKKAVKNVTGQVKSLVTGAIIAIVTGVIVGVILYFLL